MQTPQEINTTEKKKLMTFEPNKSSLYPGLWEHLHRFSWFKWVSGSIPKGTNLLWGGYIALLKELAAMSKNQT